MELYKKKGYDPQNSILILLYGKIELRDQLIEIVNLFDEFKWSKIIFIPTQKFYTRNFKHKLFNSLGFIFYLLYVRMKFAFIPKANIGITPLPNFAFNRYIFNFLGITNLIITDEGLGQIKIIADFFSLLESVKTKCRKKGRVKSFFRFNDNPISSVEVFSNYELNVPPIAIKSSHNFEYFKSLFAGRGKNIKKFTVFLGSPYLITIKSFDLYIECIKKATLNLKQDEIILYAPHRMERKEDVSKILRYFPNFKIFDSHYPIELRLLFEDITPYKLIGFGSTAIISIKRLFNTKIKETIVIKPNIELNENSRMIYDYLSNQPDVIVLNN